MKRLVSVLFLTFLSICISAQTVSNVVASQEGNSIVVSYEIDKSSPEVGLTVSTDGGKTFSAPLKKVSGDVKNVQPGRRSIVWDVLAEMESFKGDNIVFNVIAKSENSHNGHEWVDLGLSVKWATCNVGASSPEGYGDYFAWGETTSKRKYIWATLKYCKGNTGYSYSKYNQNQGGTKDNKTTLELSDDVARANWGGSWRMPTINEFRELIDECTWTWTKMNGKNGYKVTSKSNGNSIFLPAAGRRYGTFLDYDGSDGNYWSSSLYESYSYDARGLFFDSGNHSTYYYDFRRNGHSVRPVCP